MIGATASKPIVVIGAGQAGFQFAASLRQNGSNTPITIIGDEGHLPYMRPPLSKTYLQGTASALELYFRQRDWYSENNIEVILGQPVDNISAVRKVVQVGTNLLPFEKLVFATGARSRHLEAFPSQDPRVVYLRNLNDAAKAMTLLNNSDSVIVVGGGFIGLEFSSIARKAEKRVTVVETASRLLARAASPLLSEWILQLHQNNGVQLHVATDVVNTNFSSSTVRLDLSGGSSVDADFVVVGVGAVANTELASQVGLEIANGIVVNSCLETSLPNVFAIGDCANFPLLGNRNVRLESVQNAVDQAKYLAGHFTGKLGPYATVPWFWSDQFDTKIQIAGLLPHSETANYKKTGDDAKFSFHHGIDQQVFCVESINDPRSHLAARKTLTGYTPHSE